MWSFFVWLAATTWSLCNLVNTYIDELASAIAIPVFI